MPTLTIQHVSYNPPTSDRSLRPVSATGGFTLLETTTSVIEANHQFQFDVNLIKQTFIKGGKTYLFSFVSITGLAGGTLTWLDHAAAPKPAMTSTANVSARIIYMPESLTVNQSGNGAWIDAFDESTGSLVNNDFVTVNPDNESETVLGNLSGFVHGAQDVNKFPPPAIQITVTAYSHITHDPEDPGTVNANFVEWVNMNPGIRPIRSDSKSFVSPTTHSTVMLAFYKNVVFRQL